MIRLLGPEEFSSFTLNNPNLYTYKCELMGLNMTCFRGPNILLGAFMIVLMPLLASCSIEASIHSLSSRLLQTKSVNKELVPSSHQGIVTAQGYKVQSSVNFQSGDSKVTTAQGFKVQTNVQATLFIEE